MSETRNEHELPNYRHPTYEGQAGFTEESFKSFVFLRFSPRQSGVYKNVLHTRRLQSRHVELGAPLRVKEMK